METQNRFLRSKVLVLFALALGAALAAWLFLWPLMAQETLAKSVERCNKETTQLRFSCFRKALEDAYQGQALEEYIASIEADPAMNFKIGDEVTYAVFGTNCHTFYHALGDFVGTHGDKGLKELVDMGPLKCTGGYVMGLYKRMALEQGYPTELLKMFYQICRPEERVQCAHEIGHALHDKYTTALLSAVDGISRTVYGLQLPEYQYTTFPDELPDLDAPFRECDEIIPEEEANLRLQCRTGIGHNMFVFSEFDPQGYEPQFAHCAQATGSNQEDCFAFLIYRIGINETATKFISYQFDEGNEACAQAVELAGKEEFKQHCYVGLGGGIGLFVDSEYPIAEITEESLPQIKGHLTLLMELCERSAEGFVDNCYAGLLGTKFARFYDQLKLHNERIELIRPELQEIEVVG